MLTLGANKNENVTVVFAAVEAISHGDITSIGEEVQRAGNQTCRGDSLDVDGPGDRTGWLCHAGTAPSRRYGHLRDSRAARVVPLVCSQPAMASRTGRRCPTVPALSRHQQHRPIFRYVCRRDICHLRRFPQLIAEDAA